MRRRPVWVRVVRGAITLAIVGWSAFPILLIVLASVQPQMLLFRAPPTFFFTPTLENYAAILASWPDFVPGLLNSLIVTAGATVLTVGVSAMAGYVYSRYRGVALSGSAFFMIVLRMFPPLVITLPLFPVVNAIGLNDTHLILILLYSSFYISLATWIMKGFIDGIPRELDEAAMIDGAGPLQILLRVVAPLVLNGMVASAVFVAIFAWKEFLFALIFTTDQAKTAPLVISEMLGAATGAEWGPVFAASVVQMVPITIFVLCVQKYLVAGLTAGAVKG